MSNYHGIKAATLEYALNIATANSKLEEMKLLIQSGARVDGNEHCTPLCTATGLGLKAPAQLLIKLGADLEAQNENQLTPLLVACSLGGPDGAELAMLLINEGANVHYVRAADCMDAVKFAAKICRMDVLEALLAKGALVDGMPDSDQTALMLAARANNVKALKVLVNHGADTSLKCKLKWANGETAEGLARMEGNEEASSFLKKVGNTSTNKPLNRIKKWFI